MLVLRPMGDQEQDPAAGEVLHDGVQEGLGLGIHPVQAVEDQQQGLDPALVQNQPPEGVQHVLAAAERIEGLPPGIVGRDVENLQEGGRRGPGVLLQGMQVRGDLVADRARGVLRVDLEVGPQRLEERQVRGRLPGGDADRLQGAPA